MNHHQTITTKENVMLVLLFTFLIFSILIIKSENLTQENTCEEEIENNYEEKINEPISIEENVTEKENEYIDIDEIISEENSSKQEIIEEINNSVEKTNITKEQNETIIKNETQKSTKETNHASNSNKEKEENKNITIENETKEKEVEKIKISLFKNGKKEIEGEIPEDFDDEIKKEENIKENEKSWEKEVIVKSDSHLNEELLVYTDIKENTLKEQIEIYWKNEDKKIEIEKYIDSDKDGFIERIAWIVPHLSTQVFEIKINFIQNNESANILIDLISPENNSETNNPVNFKFDIDYDNIEDLECELLLNDKIYLIDISNKTLDHVNLENGEYEWVLNCSDISNSNSEQISGNFKIDEDGIESGDLDNAYLLGEDVSFLISSEYSNTNIKLTKPDNSQTSFSFTNNLIEIDSNNLNQIGFYEIEIESSGTNKPTITETKNFSIINIELTTNKNDLVVDDDLVIYVTITSPEELIYLYNLNFGDGDEKVVPYYPYVNSVSETLTHSYSDEGTYDLNLTALIGGKKFTVLKENIDVEDDEDDDAPEIDLIEPASKETIYSSTVEFIFEAEDNVKISNCTFELYDQTTIVGVLEYDVTKTNIQNNEEISIPMYGFEEGDYSWYVTCVDNASNEETESRHFTISFDDEDDEETYDNEEEVEELMETLENFIEKEASLSIDEQNALEELGISKNLIYYQKRLLQIDQDLSNNLKYITNDNLRKEREKESLKELEEIKEKIPKSFSIEDSEEFIINSVSENLEEIIRKYFDITKTSISSSSLKSLVKENEELQQKLTVSTEVKQIKIEYIDKTDKITLVTKGIKSQEDSIDKILENFPSDIDDITLLTDSNELSNGFYEIDLDDLNENKIIYKIEGFIDASDLKKIDTILFKESFTKQMPITGYFLFETSEIDYSNSLIALIILIFVISGVGFNYKENKKKKKWKQNPKIRESVKYLASCKTSLQEKNISLAKQEYHKLKQIFPELPQEYKEYLYKHLEKIQLEINKKDIIELVKEYEKAKRENRKNDSVIFYNNIQKTYKKLPKKYQEKIYNRVVKKPHEEFL